MKKISYQENLSLHSPVLLDREYKRPKVEKMLSILREVGAIDGKLGELAVDVGCSIGFFSEPMVPYFKQVLGIDIDRNALQLAVAKEKQAQAVYVLADSMQLPLPDSCADLVICNHVYEHVPDAEKLFAEIFRILKNNGICYLGAASRLTIIEPHYGLPFLSWLPKPLANIYLRMFNKGEYYYENLRTYWGIRNLLKKFSVIDYTLRVITDPDKYCARDLIPRNSLLAKLPAFFWKMVYSFLPTYLLILKKV